MRCTLTSIVQHELPYHLLYTRNYQRLHEFLRQDSRSIKINPIIRAEYLKHLLCPISPITQGPVAKVACNSPLLCLTCSNAPNKFAASGSGTTKWMCWLCGNRANDRQPEEKTLLLCQWHAIYGPLRKCYICNSIISPQQFPQSVPLPSCNSCWNLIACGGSSQKCCRIVCSEQDPAAHLLLRIPIKLYF